MKTFSLKTLGWICLTASLLIWILVSQQRHQSKLTDLRQQVSDLVAKNDRLRSDSVDIQRVVFQYLHDQRHLGTVEEWLKSLERTNLYLQKEIALNLAPVSPKDPRIWQALVLTGGLNSSLTLEQAEAIVGPHTKFSDDFAKLVNEKADHGTISKWLSGGGKVTPCYLWYDPGGEPTQFLRAQLNNGRLVDWEIGQTDKF